MKEHHFWGHRCRWENEVKLVSTEVGYCHKLIDTINEYSGSLRGTIFLEKVNFFQLLNDSST